VFLLFSHFLPYFPALFLSVNCAFSCYDNGFTFRPCLSKTSCWQADIVSATCIVRPETVRKEQARFSQSANRYLFWLWENSFVQLC